MKTLKIFTIVVIALLCGGINLEAKKTRTNAAIVKQMKKEIEKDLVSSFNSKDISKIVDEKTKLNAVVTLRVCPNCSIKIMKVEGCSNELQKLIADSINEVNIKTDEICKFRRFRVPLTFMIH